MPAQMPSPDGRDADALLHSMPERSGKIPCSVGADDGTEEEEEKVVVKVELPVSQPSPFLEEVPKAEEEQQPEHVAVVDKEDSDSSLEAEEELSEYIDIDLREIRKDVQCPICLGIIKKTRTVMECLHRFCRECIDKSMRMGNNECPACRTHCPSRRSLRDDPMYDALIAVLFPDIEKYEEEELALCEEDKSRNKQIQASIAQTLQRQSEALGKKRSPKKGTRAQSSSRSQKKTRKTPSRRRKRSEETELEASDNDGELENEERTSSYSGDQHRHKTRRRIGSSGPRSSATSSDGGCMENNLEQMRSYPGLTWGITMRAWGKSGSRSNTPKKPQPTYLAKLVELIHSIEKKEVEENAAAVNSSSHLLAAANEAPEGSHDKQDRMSDAAEQSQTRPQTPEEKETRTFAAYCISHRGELVLACQQKEAI